MMEICICLLPPLRHLHPRDKCARRGARVAAATGGGLIVGRMPFNPAPILLPSTRSPKSQHGRVA